MSSMARSESPTPSSVVNAEVFQTPTKPRVQQKFAGTPVVSKSAPTTPADKGRFEFVINTPPPNNDKKKDIWKTNRIKLDQDSVPSPVMEVPVEAQMQQFTRMPPVANVQFITTPESHAYHHQQRVSVTPVQYGYHISPHTPQQHSPMHGHLQEVITPPSNKDALTVLQQLNAYQMNGTTGLLPFQNGYKNPNRKQQKEQSPNPAQPKATVDPKKFKTKMCKNWQKTGMCSYEHTCCFAHGDHELRDAQTNVSALTQLGYSAQSKANRNTNQYTPQPQQQPQPAMQQGQYQTITTLVPSVQQLPLHFEQIPLQQQIPNTAIIGNQLMFQNPNPQQPQYIFVVPQPTY